MHYTKRKKKFNPFQERLQGRRRVRPEKTEPETNQEQPQRRTRKNGTNNITKSHTQTKRQGHIRSEKAFFLLNKSALHKARVLGGSIKNQFKSS